jgi:hypothetical protein
LTLAAVQHQVQNVRQEGRQSDELNERPPYVCDRLYVADEPGNHLRIFDPATVPARSSRTAAKKSAVLYRDPEERRYPPLGFEHG